MIILGIDPGTARMGYGIIKKEGGKTLFLDAGILKIHPVRSSPPLGPYGARSCAGATSNGVKNQNSQHIFLQIKIGLEEVIKKWKPEIMAIEKIYFSKNQKTAMSVAEARGVAILTGLENGLEIREYSPNEIKAGLTGYGHADKRGVAKMVNLALGTPKLKIIDDASDALAIAIFAADALRIEER
ncbi:MAG: crossover junction endodeoxyribonuclease RuvC [Candidatus Liptonbacteria bacterium]|nr:crossover junction endodeoxyribonuclease RuvC [Candidatus Liptonbacteria bacterium]